MESPPAKITFNGFVIDLFQPKTGDLLGITVGLEKDAHNPDSPCVDIIVDSNLDVQAHLCG